MLRLSWIAGAGPAPTGYLLQAGRSPGLANITTLSLGPVPEIVVPGVPPGVYWLRLLAVNGCGVSAPSANFPLLVDVETAPPLGPLGFTGSASGGVVQSWVEPPYLTPTSYLLEAGLNDLELRRNDQLQRRADHDAALRAPVPRQLR